MLKSSEIDDGTSIPTTAAMGTLQHRELVQFEVKLFRENSGNM